MNVPTDVNTPLDDEPALLVSARTVHFGALRVPPHDAVVADGDVVRSARVTAPGMTWEDVWNRTDRWLKLLDLPRMMDQSRMVESLWDLIHWNEESLIEDATLLHRGKAARTASPPARTTWCSDDDVWLGQGREARARLRARRVAGAGRDRRQRQHRRQRGHPGPLLRRRERRDQAADAHPPRHAASARRAASAARSPSSIILGFSNKSHEGFMGHSYVGKWVNLGAGTTTSNLKNTYGEISVQIGSQEDPHRPAVPRRADRRPLQDRHPHPPADRLLRRLRQHAHRAAASRRSSSRASRTGRRTGRSRGSSTRP